MGGPSRKEKTGALAADQALRRRAYLGHVLPFALWIAVLLVFEAASSLGLDLPRAWAPWAYAAKSLLCAALLLLFRPWRFDRAVPLRAGGLLLGLVAGLVVTVLWIVPELPWVFGRFRSFSVAYHEWAITPPGAFPSYFVPDLFPALPAGHPSLAYSPAEAGWPLTIAKLLGSAFVIAAAEEYFFRGFLYRWLRKGAFWEIPLSVYDAAAFWGVVAVFGLEHDRWLAGMMAGAVYGFVALRTGRLLPAVVAHMTTNLLLGLYVILSGQYGFW